MNNPINNNDFRVSIIILSYNQEKYIEQSLRSVLEQETKYNLEIIIADDNSKDRTIELATKYATAFPGKIVLRSNPRNLGIVPNFVDALSLCSGDFLCILGGDDYWIDKTKIQKQVDFLIKNPEYGLVYSDYSVLNNTNNNLTDYFLRKSGAIPIEGDAAHIAYKGDKQIMSLTVCLRMSLLNSEYRRIMNDPFFLAEDFPTFFWVSMFSKFHFIPMNSAVYRVHNDSYTNSHDHERLWKFVRSHTYMRLKLLGYFKYKPVDWDYSNSVTHKLLLRLSLKTGMNKKIGLASYRYLIKNKKAVLEDHFVSIGIKCPKTSNFIKGILFIKNRFKNFILNKTCILI